MPGNGEEFEQTGIDGNETHGRIRHHWKKADHEGYGDDAGKALAEPENEDGSKDYDRGHLQDEDVGIERLLQPDGKSDDHGENKSAADGGDESQDRSAAGEKGGGY